MAKISPHFKREEFKCKCGECERTAVDHELLVVLEDLRSWIGEELYINSGNRCPEYNKKVGGSLNSKHLYSLAADVRAKTVSSEEIYSYLDNKYPNKYGLGLYSTWVHIDVRDDKARWNQT